MTRPRLTLDPNAPVRSLRDALGLPQGDFGAPVGMSKQGVSNAEQRGSAVKLGTLLAMAEAHGLEIDILARKRC